MEKTNNYNKILEYYRLYHWRQFAYKKRFEETGYPIEYQEMDDVINDAIIRDMKIEGKL